MTPENPNIPDWAHRERQEDHAWIVENLDVFWAASSLTFAETGRGAIVVDTKVQPVPGLGHPFGYFSQAQVDEAGNDDAKRMVREYDPTQAFVLVLLKSGDRMSTYRANAILPENQEPVLATGSLRINGRPGPRRG